MSVVESNTRIIELLAQGIAPKNVLTIIGCKIEYLNGLLADEEFQEAVSVKAQEYLKEADEEEIVTNKYLSLENSLLKRIEQESASASMAEAVKALQIVSQRQDKHYDRKKSAAPVGDGNALTTVNVVSLHLPQHAIPEYRTNTENEVIAVGDKVLAPMSSKVVETMFIEAKKEQATG